MDHLLINCKFIHALCSELFLMFGLQWVMPRTVVSLLFAWENVDHLLIHCKFAHSLWSEVFLMFGLQWVMPRMVVSLLFAWENYLGLHSSV